MLPQWSLLKSSSLGSAGTVGTICLGRVRAIRIAFGSQK
jgi:hypothetical protein